MGTVDIGTLDVGTVDIPDERSASVQVSTAHRAASAVNPRADWNPATIAFTSGSVDTVRNASGTPSSTAATSKPTSRRAPVESCANASFRIARHRSTRWATSGRTRSESRNTSPMRSTPFPVIAKAPLPRVRVYTRLTRASALRSLHVAGAGAEIDVRPARSMTARPGRTVCSPSGNDTVQVSALRFRNPQRSSSEG